MTDSGYLDQEWWKEWMIWIIKNPWNFLYYLFLCLTPLFIVSMISSWKLSKSFEAQSNKKRSPNKKGPGNSRGRPARNLRSNTSKTN